MKLFYILLIMVLCLMAPTVLSLEEQPIEEATVAVDKKEDPIVEKVKEEVVADKVKIEEEPIAVEEKKIEIIPEKVKEAVIEDKKDKDDDHDDDDDDDDDDKKEGETKEDKKKRKIEKKLRKQRKKMEKRLRKMRAKKDEKEEIKVEKEENKEEIKVEKEENKEETKEEIKIEKEEIKEESKNEIKSDIKSDESAEKPAKPETKPTESAKESTKEAKKSEKPKKDSKKSSKKDSKKDDKTFQLTSDRTFKELVFGTEYVWVVNFVDPENEDSNRFEPIYSEISRSLVGIVPAGVVNCKRTPGICDKYSITTYPHILIFPSEPEAVENRVLKTPIEYEGEYTKDAIIAECERNIPDRISHINVEENPNRLAKFLEEETPLTEDKNYIPHKFLIFTSPREGPSKSLRTMALNFHHLIDFAEIRNPTDETLIKFNLVRDELPTMIIKLSPKFNKGVDESIRFKGKTSQDLVDFLTPYSKNVKDGIVNLDKDEL